MIVKGFGSDGEPFMTDAPFMAVRPGDRVVIGGLYHEVVAISPDGVVYVGKNLEEQGWDVAYAEKHGRGWRARWRDKNGKLRSASGFATRRDAEDYGQNHERNTVRYVVGTDHGQFYIEPYGNDETEVFASKTVARATATEMNEAGIGGGFIPGPDRTLIKVRPWKVYELVEVE